MTRLSSR